MTISATITLTNPTADDAKTLAKLAVVFGAPGPVNPAPAPDPKPEAAEEAQAETPA